MWEYFIDLDRANRSKRISKDKVEEHIKIIEQKYPKLQSNDLPVLGLARAGGVKLLCTKDKDLKKDFQKVIRQGKVYDMSRRSESKKNKLARSLLNKNTCPSAN